MKHATAETLEQIGSLLAGLHRLPHVVERKPGVFYVKGKAFLHFHEDNDWKRFAVNDARDRSQFLKLATRTLSGTGA